jgi:hypothetical protein
LVLLRSQASRRHLRKSLKKSESAQYVLGKQRIIHPDHLMVEMTVMMMTTTTMKTTTKKAMGGRAPKCGASECLSKS